MPKITIEEAIKGLRGNSLTEVDLSGVSFTKSSIIELASALAKNTSVTSMNLANCTVKAMMYTGWVDLGHISPCEADYLIGEHIALALNHNRTLSSLDVSNVDLYGSRYGILSMLKINKTLQYLNISNCQLIAKTSKTCRQIQDIITRNHRYQWAIFFKSHTINEEKNENSNAIGLNTVADESLPDGPSRGPIAAIYNV